MTRASLLGRCGRQAARLWGASWRWSRLPRRPGRRLYWWRRFRRLPSIVASQPHQRQLPSRGPPGSGHFFSSSLIPTAVVMACSHSRARVPVWIFLPCCGATGRPSPLSTATRSAYRWVFSGHHMAGASRPNSPCFLFTVQFAKAWVKVFTYVGAVFL
jgi:hypothetical protein